MSKCKGVLDGDKITEIQVKTKTQEKQQKAASDQKSSDKPKLVSNVTL